MTSEQGSWPGFEDSFSLILDPRIPVELDLFFKESPEPIGHKFVKKEKKGKPLR